MSLVNESNLGLAATGASPRDYVVLLKPRVMSLVVLTALAGLLLAQPVHPVIGVVSLLAITVGAGASGALNMWYDADIDRLMARTALRPIPAGRMGGSEALAFGLVLSFFSVIVLGLAANWLAAGLLAFTIFYYVIVYTMWLKRSTPQNIVIGGAAGALPPMVGYAAATGSIRRYRRVKTSCPRSTPTSSISPSTCATTCKPSSDSESAATRFATPIPIAH